ncbi:hypothetical protein ACFV5G_34220 [Streptomyces sp. NPDC059766]|uniref:hypothetical protein n=1 Tax=Streptomyces sp. NPDC059766 TaxID=3346940 RepID=UPI00364C2E87
MKSLRKSVANPRVVPEPLAAKVPELVCVVNQAFLAGYLNGLGSEHGDAMLAPRPGACCVELRGKEMAGGTLETGTTCGR